ncbi:MAG TPA: ATP-binding protein [Pyrinomonadaceae bacterium]
MTIEIEQLDNSERISAAMLRWINEHGAQGIITTDEHLRLTSWNRWLEVHTNRKAETVVGRNLLDLFPELTERKLDTYYRRALEGQSGVLSQKFHRFLLEMSSSLDEDNEPMYQSVRISPLLEKGLVVGTVTVIEDVTERVKREAELQRQLEERAHLLAAESIARNAAESASRRLQHLQMVTDEALAQMSLDDLLLSSVKAVRSILNADAAGILLAEPNGDLIIRATDGIDADLVGVTVPAGTSFSGVVARERRPQTMAGNFPLSPFTESLGDRVPAVLAGVPLIVDKRLIGVLSIAIGAAPANSEDDLRFMSLVADRIALAIERISLYERERSARAQAEEANRLKDQFLATVSHELRTPLNAILGWARMLTSGRIDEETAKHALEVIERNARVQAQLIDDLLDVSRIISGKLHLNISPIEPLNIVQLALDAVRPAAEAKEIELQTNFGPETDGISGDPDRIQQIIWNLLSNAIKFTPNGGKVNVQVTRESAHIEFVVTDTGQGISEEFLPFVFERFRQADSTAARTHGGLGLGLAIVRHLTELHGGVVNANSAGVGHGATFNVRLPIQAPRVQVATVENNSTTNEEKSPAFDCPGSLEGLDVLIVDDENDALELMKTVLRECGAKVRVASSAAEALESIKTMPPDILISDIEMPNQDGYSLIRTIRTLPVQESQGILAIALTAHANETDRNKALAAGFQIHIRKPVDPAELVEAMAGLIAGRDGQVTSPNLVDE